MKKVRFSYRTTVDILQGILIMALMVVGGAIPGYKYLKGDFHPDSKNLVIGIFMAGVALALYTLWLTLRNSVLILDGKSRRWTFKTGRPFFYERTSGDFDVFREIFVKMEKYKDGMYYYHVSLKKFDDSILDVNCFETEKRAIRDAREIARMLGLDFSDKVRHSIPFVDTIPK
jgi:hypothetical protein